MFSPRYHSTFQLHCKVVRRKRQVIHLFVKHSLIFPRSPAPCRPGGEAPRADAGHLSPQHLQQQAGTSRPGAGAALRRPQPAALDAARRRSRGAVRAARRLSLPAPSFCSFGGRSSVQAPLGRAASEQPQPRAASRSAGRLLCCVGRRAEREGGRGRPCFSHPGPRAFLRVLLSPPWAL